MSMKPTLVVLGLLSLLLSGCQVITRLAAEPTPLPGWRTSLVTGLLLGDNAFPDGWARIRDMPAGSLTDVTINHVYRSWWDQAEDCCLAEQGIWRARTVEDARDKYAELRQIPLFSVGYTPSPYDYYVEFTPPDEIDFQSHIADEYYLACGWAVWASCEVMARYRNYVVELRLDLEAQREGHTTQGLTYEEIEDVVAAMDARFAEAMAEFYPAPQ